MTARSLISVVEMAIFNSVSSNFKLFNPARRLSTSAITNAIQTVTIIGAGTMGAGIAQVAAVGGNTVRLVDVNEAVLDNSKKIIATSLGRIAKKKFKDDPSKGTEFCSKALGQITFMTQKERSVDSTDLVIEAIVENLKVKQGLFLTLDAIAPKETIFATNTSAIPIHEIAKVTKRADKFLGVHFFSPAPVMKLVEVIRTDKTSEETFKAIDSWGKVIGKVLVPCRDTPGFVLNRLLIPFIVNAVRMAERGDALPKDIDTVMKLGAGHPMGPFELSDAVGIDIVAFVCADFEKRFPNDPQYKVPQIIKQKLQEGKLGVKTKEGFYKYGDKK